MSEDLQIDAQVTPSMNNRDKVELNFHFNYTRIEEMGFDKSLGLLTPRIILEAIDEMNGGDFGLYDRHGG